MLGIGLFILIMATGGCSGTGSNVDAGNTMSQKQQIVDLESFLKEFDKNKALALEKYKGRNILTNGYVDIICVKGLPTCPQNFVLVKPGPDQVVNGHPTYYMGSTIQCFTGQSQVASLSPGKAVTVSGPVDDYVVTMQMGNSVMGMVTIKSCKLA